MLSNNRHQPLHARRIRYGDERLAVAAPIHEVLIFSEDGVIGTAKISFA